MQIKCVDVRERVRDLRPPEATSLPDFEGHVPRPTLKIKSIPKFDIDLQPNHTLRVKPYSFQELLLI